MRISFSFFFFHFSNNFSLLVTLLFIIIREKLKKLIVNVNKQKDALKKNGITVERKEKKIKGTGTVPLPPPTEIGNFSYTPQKYSKDQRCQSIPSEMAFEAPNLPPHQKILSIVVGNESGYLNGIDHNAFMVRGIVLIVLVSLKKTTATTTFLHKK